MLYKDIIEIGFALGLIVNAILFIPQALSLYRKKRSNELSLITFIGFNVIQFFYILHALVTKDLILLVGTLSSFITCGIVTILILLYRQ